MAGIVGDGSGPLTRSASAVATELIRAAVIDGRLEPGQRLKEEELARELGISRTPVREALLVLQTEGLLESAPNRGATVRTFEADDLDDLYQLRAVLEGFAARRAAARITDAELALLSESNERFVRLRDADEIADLVRENVRFHDAILAAAGSERLTQLVRGVIQLPLVYRSYFWYSPEQKLISEHYHRQLTAALAVRDAERAELVMKEHVLEARDFLVARLRGGEQGAGAT
ncbi:MAG: GntR family transcriptional regulator [Thermoleophilia bacterium]|nr:GntR family transcriptional regulator [Thermoleophilia bacterium]